MDAVEAAGLNPPGDAARRESGPEELLVRDDAVLPGGDPGDDLVRVDAFLPHTGNKASEPSRAPLDDPAYRVAHRVRAPDGRSSAAIAAGRAASLLIPCRG